MSVMPYQNEPVVDWTEAARSSALKDAIAHVRASMGQQYPLWINGRAVHTDKTLASVNPSRHEEVIGQVSQATTAHIDEAIAGAKDAFESWRLTSFESRAKYLFKAAEMMRRRKAELMACQILESGKNWAEADGDVNEAIDFLEFYARNAIELGNGQELYPFPGEDNSMMYIPLGVGVVIPPWNFPLAILTGTTASALVTGNTILLKPSPLSSVMAAKFVEIMNDLQLPKGVLNFVPGAPEDIGDYMTGHRDVKFVSFTGSKAVGVHIDEMAHRKTANQRFIKRVVAEMGGKDGTVVDETADLDDAADGIVAAAFGFQGQKCSAGSRAIIHEAVYDELLDKIVEKAKQLTVAPSEDNPDVGPVIDAKAFKKITGYIDIGKQEGRLVLGGTYDDSKGYFVQPTMIADCQPDARVMKEEIFGPVLSITKVASYEEGVRVFNDTEYGLTGAVYSRLRERLEHARLHMHCGNLYFNRKCTGSLVGVQPFGGFDMSGTDAKAGSKDYLLNFVQPKTITERF